MSRPEFSYCPQCRAPLERRERGGKQRLTCSGHGCGFVHWDNPIPVVGAIVERDGHVLLVRSHGRPPNWYALVTGFLETGETPEHAVLREVEEELGIGAELQSCIGAYPFELLNQIIFVYHVIGAPGPVRLCEEELADWKAVPFADVRPWPRGTGPALQEWLARRGYHPPVVELGKG